VKNYLIITIIFFLVSFCAVFKERQEYSEEYPKESKKYDVSIEPQLQENTNLSNDSNLLINQKQYNTNQNINQKRQIIYESKLDIQVKKIDESINKIKAIVVNHKGYIESIDIKESNQDTYLKIRIPVDKFFDTLEEFFKIGKVISYSIAAEDVSRKIQDVESRLKTLKSLRERLYELFKKVKKVEEKAKILKEINRLTSQIEDLETRQKYLENKAAFSTIEILLKTIEKQSDNNLTQISPFSWVKTLDPLKRTIYNENYNFLYKILMIFALKTDFFESLVKSIKVPADFFDNKNNFLNYPNSTNYAIYNPSGVGLRIGYVINEPFGNKDFWINAVINEFSKRNYYILEKNQNNTINYVHIKIDDGIKEYYYTIGVFIKSTIHESYIVIIEIFYPNGNTYEKYKKIIGEIL
jgi:hypothetical protein